MLAGLTAKAQCYILYNYNAAGYRILTQYECGLPGPAWRHTDSSKIPVDSTIISANTTVAPTDTIIMNTCSLYPNPSNGVFTAVLKYPVQNADVYISDAKGVVISRKKMDGTETDFDIRQYPPDVYIMHLKSTNYEFDAKVIKE
jgi:hypothetical protein